MKNLIIATGAILMTCILTGTAGAADDAKKKHAFTNRLAKEKSPYLLQHQHNPVDWYPWGEEAFAKAKKEDKVVLLSIGYSTCHWCHVMERESFEDEEVAKVLNKHFICVKLDREERPDIDNIYMTSMQALDMGGGWPLNVFMTPDKKPFFGGTYFPKPRFIQASEHIANLWKTQKKELLANAEEIHGKLKEMVEGDSRETSELHAALIEKTVNYYKQSFDPVHGGFTGPPRFAPKFPQPQVPTLVLRYGIEKGDKASIDQVLKTLDKMAAGGIYDHIGGGFARYAVDREWLVPHFEKMLYDNAQLIDVYLDAYLVSGDRKYADVVRDILRYVFRDMTHPEGGFYSAEDADSEGKEGKFYCFTETELQKLLTKEEFAFVAKHYGVTAKGNFVDHSDPEHLPDQNVLSVIDPKKALTDAEKKLLASADKKIFDYRDVRIRPGLDDKVLASWNGLMLGAVARASVVLGDDAYLAAAKKNLAFLQSKLWDAKTKTLYHRWRDGSRDSVQLQATYAYLLDGVIDLYEATLEPSYLQFANDLANTMTAKFYDPKKGGFYLSGSTDDLIFAVKDEYDGAEPSGNSVAVMALGRLAVITENKEMLARVKQTLTFFSSTFAERGAALPLMLQALGNYLEEPMRVVITGGTDATALIRSAHQTYRPNKVVLGNTGPVEAFAKTLKSVKGKATAYVCTGKFCNPPTSDGKVVQGYLKMVVKK